MIHVPPNFLCCKGPFQQGSTFQEMIEARLYEFKIKYYPIKGAIQAYFIECVFMRD